MKSEHSGPHNNNEYDFQPPKFNDVIVMASNLLANDGNNPDEYYLCRESDPQANDGGDKILMVNINKKPISEAMNSAKLIFTNLKIEVMLISHGKLFKIK